MFFEEMETVLNSPNTTWHRFYMLVTFMLSLTFKDIFKIQFYVAYSLKLQRRSTHDTCYMICPL